MCDGDLPCESCLSVSVNCSYSGVRKSSPSFVAPIQHQIADTEVLVRETEHEATNASQKVSIPFLLNYTDQSSKSPYDLHCILGGDSSDLTDDSFSTTDPFPELWSSLFHAFINPSAIEPRSSDTTHYYGLDDSEALLDTAERLKSHLDCCDTERFNQQNVDISAAKSFFCSPRLGEYVHSFFDHSSHTNCVIHRASFSVNTASTHLLLVVIILGAVCISHEDAVVAQSFSEIVQLSIFEGPEFQQILSSRSPPRSKENVQLVQAAMLVVVLRSGKEEFEINRRFRIKWFPALVSIVRSLRLTQAINNVKPDRQAADLDDYIHQETLVR